MHPRRQLIHVPAGPRGNGLRFVVITQCGPIRPRGIAAEYLRDAGEERELESEKPDRPAHDERWLDVVGQTLAPHQWGVENGQQPGFEQQRIPLELEKQLACYGQRQIQQPK